MDKFRELAIEVTAGRALIDDIAQALRRVEMETREECAKIADNYFMEICSSGVTVAYDCKEVGAAIRTQSVEGVRG